VTESVDTEKGVPDGFFLTSNVHKIHFRPGLHPGPRWGSLQCLCMLVKVPVWFNLVLFIYPSYGPWKSLKSLWISFWQMGKNPVLKSKKSVTVNIWKFRIIVLVLNGIEYWSNCSIRFKILNIRTALIRAILIDVCYSCHLRLHFVSVWPKCGIQKYYKSILCSAENQRELITNGGIRLLGFFANSSDSHIRSAASCALQCCDSGTWFCPSHT